MIALEPGARLKRIYIQVHYLGYKLINCYTLHSGGIGGVWDSALVSHFKMAEIEHFFQNKSPPLAANKTGFSATKTDFCSVLLLISLLQTVQQLSK